MSEPSDLERTLLFQIKMAGLPAPLLELRFAPPRRWRFDMAWPSLNSIEYVVDSERGVVETTTSEIQAPGALAVEVQGGGYGANRGRHSRPAAQEAEWEKLNRAQLLGWRVLQFGPKAIESGKALTMIEQALEQE